MKICSRCGAGKELDQFRRKSAAADGRKSFCRDCDDECGRVNYAAKRKKRIAQVRAWQEKNPEKVKSYRAVK